MAETTVEIKTKGNWGKPNFANTPYTLLGKEIEYAPNPSAKTRYQNWFMVDGKGEVFKLFGEGISWTKDQYKWKIKTNIAPDGSPSPKPVVPINYNQVLIQVGEWIFGARWDIEKNEFIRVPGIEPILDNTKLRQKAIAEFGDTDASNIIPDPEKATKGRTTKNMRDLITALGKKPLDADKFTDRQSKVEGGDKTKIHDTQDNNRLEFWGKIKVGKKEVNKTDLTEGQEAIQAFYNYMTKETNKGAEPSRAIIGSLYRCLSVIGKADDPLWLTRHPANASIQDKVQRLIDVGVEYQHWAQTLVTTTDFFKKPFELYGVRKEEMMSTLDNLKKYLPEAKFKDYDPGSWEAKGGDLPNGISEESGGMLDTFAYDKKEDRYHIIPKEYGTGTFAEADEDKRDFNAYANFSSVKQVKHALAQFVSCPKIKNSFSVPKAQSADNWFFRGVPPAKHGTVGQHLSNKDIKFAMEFLETGVIPAEKYAELKRLNPLDYPDEEDKMENHYNTTVNLYKQWGLPYGRYAPANMFFRLAMSGTAWRRTEGLTATTEYAETKKALISKKWKGGHMGIHFGYKNEGVDKDGFDMPATYALTIKFFTRKTIKWGSPDHATGIPAFSSSLVNTKETINLVLEKAGIGHINIRYQKNGKFDVKFQPATKELLNKWHKETKYHKWSGQKETPELTVDLKEGHEPVITLIGYPNQFFPVGEIANADQQKKDKIHMIENNIKFYLEYPLREMFSIMTGAGITRRKDADILSIARKKRDWKILTKPKEPAPAVFTPNKYGWSTIATKHGCAGCKPGKEVPIGYNDNQKMIQDVLKYKFEEDDEYWIKHSIHSSRHIFAQTWLRQFNWDYSMVADMGHWDVVSTLKDNYGNPPDHILTEKVALGFAKDFTDDENPTDEEMAEAEATAKEAINRGMMNKDVAESLVGGQTDEEIKLKFKRKQQEEEEGEPEEESEE